LASTGSLFSTFAGAVGGSAVGSAVVHLLLDSSQYDAKLAEVKATSVDGFTATAKAATGMSAAVKAGLAAGAVALTAFAAQSVRAAADYETAFNRIDAISNASAEDIARWKEQVLDLAGRTAQAPQELADALFFLSSAGLKSGQVMEALEASAKASAVGLGDTATIAKIVAQAMNAYAKSGLTATQATDALVAAVREGTAEPEEFAGALGRVLPIAAKVGITFDQVVGSLAAMSNVGLDVNEGVTALRALLQALAAPGTQAANALQSVGLSAEDMRRALQEDGLIGALQLLDNATNGNIDTMRKIIPNIRALTGAFNLTGQSVDKARSIMEATATSAGDMGRAFQTATRSPQFAFQQLSATIEVLKIRFGEQLLPSLVEIVEALSEIVDVAGPLVQVLGHGLAGAVQALTSQMRAASDAVQLFLSALNAIPGVSVDVEDKTASFAKRIGDLTAGVLHFIPGGGALSNLLNTLGEHAEKAAGASSNLAYQDKQLGAITGDTATQTKTLAAAHEAAAQAAEEQKQAELELQGGLLGLVATYSDIQEAERRVATLRRRGRTDTAAYREAVADLASKSVQFNQDLAEFAAKQRAAGNTVQDTIGDIIAFGKQLGLRRKDLEDLIGPLEQFVRDSPYRGKIELDKGQADSALANIRNSLNDLTSHVWTIKAVVAASRSGAALPGGGFGGAGGTTRVVSGGASRPTTFPGTGPTDSAGPQSFGPRARQHRKYWAKDDVAGKLKLTGAVRWWDAAVNANVAARAFTRGSADTVIDADLPKNLAQNNVGWTYPGGRHISMAPSVMDWGRGVWENILVHEIGHTLGLDHVDDRKNIMHHIVPALEDATLTAAQRRKVIQGATGMVVRTPTFFIGEGTYSTPFGRGSEAVLPLNDQTMDRLGEAIGKRTSGGPTIIINGDNYGIDDLGEKVVAAWERAAWRRAAV